MLKIASATSGDPASLSAAAETAAAVSSGLGGVRPDLVFVFASRHHAPELEETIAAIQRSLKPRHLIGCTAGGIIGGQVEYEGRPALSVWAGSLPSAVIASSQIELDETPDGQAFPGIPEIPAGPATLLLLAEPFSFPTDSLLARLGEDHPELQVLGGMASAARSPGENRLFLGGEVLVDGAVGVVISGGVRVRPLVSQGCRPFGKPLVITKSENNIIFELGGRSALEKLAEQLKLVTPAERPLLERGLHIGLAIDARKRQHHRGDFLVRNVVGFVRDRGAIAVGDVVKLGTTVQFHLRDSMTASEDLQLLLREAKMLGAEPAGGLLFSCNGRGSRFFESPNHDPACVARELGSIPLSGFFAAGEIGPIGGQNFLHGFTASLALFEENSSDS